MATTNFLKLRGLPFAATELDVLAFLEGLPVWSDQSVIVTINDDGRPSGEALVKLEQMININDLRVYNGRFIGNRFIEVFPSSQGEFLSQESKHKMTSASIVRLRGLPYDTSVEDILMFFTRLMISCDGVGLLIGPDDIPTGEAFVQFMNKEDANMALQRHNQCIRSRYIEVYKSSMTETIRAMERQYVINKEELMKRSRGMPQRLQPKFNGMGGAPPPFPAPPNFYQDSTSYGASKGFNGGSGGPMRRGRDTSRSNRPSPYGVNKSALAGKQQFSDPSQKTIFMRGLPYTATEQDVFEFFAPLQICGVTMFRGNDGKLTGEAEAEFLSQHDAILGMEKDRQKMSWRYIELFTHAPEKV